MIKKILIAVVLFFLLISSAECESPVPQIKNIDFYPVADTYVHEKSNAMPFSKMELRVGNQNTINFGNMKSALKFDISEIPEGSIIIKAHLNAYSFDTRPSWDSRPIQAYSAPNDWSESSLDWSLLNNASAQKYESSFIAGLPGSSPDSYSWDITTMVQSWVNGEANFGIILQYDDEKLNDFIIIYSSNNLIFKPYLSVSYERTESPSTVRSLPVKNLKETNTLTVNESTVFESNDKVKEAKEVSNTAPLHHVDPPPLIAPAVLNDTLSSPVQTTPQAILPEITRHPQSQFKNPGTPVNFLVTASGTPPLLFQWQKDGVNIADETSKILTIKSITEEDAGIFTCNVSNEAGSVVSNGAELYVNDAAEIIDQPASQFIAHGKPVTFSLATSGTGPLSYQWKKDHIVIHGATAINYTIASVQKNDEGVYTCEVSNDFSNDISNDAILVVITPPKISYQPQSQVKPPGASVTFTVKALPPPLSYQWLKDGVPIDGETYETYTIDSVSENDVGSFSCNVSNDAGSMVSNGAKLFLKDAAEIIDHPISQSIVHGKPVTFSLSTAGAEPLSYQWKKEHINIYGATAKTYTIASVQKDDEGVYTCEVSNDFSNNISNDAILVVITPPQISQQPLSQIENPGMPVTFSVIATGTPPFSFQWLKNGVEIDGEISERYTIDIVSEKDEGTFTCKVANDAGKLLSKPAILSVNNPPEITSHPLSRTINPKSSVKFSVIASGKPPILYQWMKNGIVISNAVTDTYVIHSASEEDEGEFTCIVTNILGSLTSKPALLSVNKPPKISHHPLSQTSNPNAVISFSVKASGTPPLSYQWLKEGAAINSATFDSYTIDSVSEIDEGVYTCTVTNDAGILTSNQAVLTLNDSVKIIDQPLSVSKNAGESVTFSLEATGTEPLSFQWEKNGHNIIGATSKSYTITSIQNADGGAYKCRVNNDFSSIISNRADLILKNSAQINEHPKSQSKNPGTHVEFSVIATGTPPLLFQWQKDGVDIDGATSKIFKILVQHQKFLKLIQFRKTTKVTMHAQSAMMQEVSGLMMQNFLLMILFRS